jgi:spermidine synthase
MLGENNKNYLFFLSFLEGGAVMACELIGAKLLAPYFGTSLYVWAAALGLTLGGLTIGYFVGGRLSKRYTGSTRLLYSILVAAAALLVLMPFTSNFIMEATINLPLELGAIFSLIVFMVPPLILMGMVSPVIINLLTEQAKSAGSSAGNVYAISTTGGILITFLMGFWVIPEYGLRLPAIVTGFLLAALPLLSLIKQAKSQTFFLPLLLGFAYLSLHASPQYNEEYKILYQSDGILGQVKVVDYPSYEITDNAALGRGLIVNNTLQTYVGHAENFAYSIWSWANYFPTAASVFPEGSKVLLLGLGGGTLVKQLNRLGFEVDVVEIDRRIWEVSVTHFGLDPNTNIFIDDARHYVKTTNKTYDIVIFDTFLSESVPEHLLTLEGITDTKEILRPGGMIMANFYGFLQGKNGKAARSVYKTIKAAGLVTELLATPGTEGSRNLIFLGALEEKDFSKTRYTVPTLPTIEDLYMHFVDARLITQEEAYLLTDQQPRLSKLYARAAMSWKESYNDYYRRHFQKGTK